MKYIICIITIIGLILPIFLIQSAVEASEGLPGSAKFGYGARIVINGRHLDKSIATATSIGIDWIAVEFDWERMWSDPSSPPNISQLSDAINKAYRSGLSVLLTITNPPSWALTERGPDPQTTANLILTLVDFYTDKILAVELFPGVNTQEGWKANPDPRSYLNVLTKIQETLNLAGKKTTVITTLAPVALNPSPNDVNDRDFLKQIYQSGGKSNLTIIGIKFNKVSGDPYSNPNPLTLRHYEEIRNVMLNFEHDFGLIWITGFSLPNGQINVEPSNDHFKSIKEKEQSKWLEEAFVLMKAQLYIGAAFYNQINPDKDDHHSNSVVTLISPDSQIHPAVDNIRSLIGQYSTKSNLSMAGTSGHLQENITVDGHQTYLTILLKKYIKQTDFKHP